MNLSEEKMIAEIQESQARIYKMLAEVDKLRAETRHEEKSTFKVIVEAYFYPFIVLATLLGAYAAFIHT